MDKVYRRSITINMAYRCTTKLYSFVLICCKQTKGQRCSVVCELHCLIQFTLCWALKLFISLLCLNSPVLSVYLKQK